MKIMQRSLAIACLTMLVLLLPDAVLAMYENIGPGVTESHVSQDQIVGKTFETEKNQRRYAQASNKEARGKKDKTKEARKDTEDSDSARDSGRHTDANSDSGPNAAAQGNEKSAEMRSRRDERKEIQEEYRGGDKSENKSGKKPWWKFWEEEQ